MIKEGNNGLGMQLRLGAGPLINAAAAAKLCAGLAENDRHCETTVFDGQRLSMRGSDKGTRQKTQGQRASDKNQDKNSEKSQELGAASRDRPCARSGRQAREASPQLLLQALTSARSPRLRLRRSRSCAAAKPETASASSTISSFFRR